MQRGARVRAGQLLLELENQDLAGAAAESRAAFDLAEATYETTAKATVPQEVQKAELDVRAAKDASRRAAGEFSTTASVSSRKARSRRKTSTTRRRTSARRAASTRPRRKRLEDLQGFARDQALKAAAAQRDAAQGPQRGGAGAARVLRESPARSTASSPISRSIPGEMPPSGAPIVTVMDLSQVIARAHISQAEAAELTVGNEANLIGPGGAPIPAKVTQISPALDATNTTVEVWVQAANPDGKLRPGHEPPRRNDREDGAERAGHSAGGGAHELVGRDLRDRDRQREQAAPPQDRGRHPRRGKVQVTDGLESGQRVATTGAFELFKLDPEVLAKTKVQIAPAEGREKSPRRT